MAPWLPRGIRFGLRTRAEEPPPPAAALCWLSRLAAGWLGMKDGPHRLQGTGRRHWFPRDASWRPGTAMSKNLSQAHPDNSGPAIVGACDPSRRKKSNARRRWIGWQTTPRSVFPNMSPVFPATIKPWAKHRPWVDVCVGVGKKYSIPSSSPNRSQSMAGFPGLPAPDGAWVGANGRLLD